MSDTPAITPARPQCQKERQVESRIQSHNQGHFQSQSQADSESHCQNQAYRPNSRRIRPTQDPFSVSYLTPQQLASHRLHTEIVSLLNSRKPRTLHIRQRYADAICPRRQGGAARVRERYGECRAVLGAVVFELEFGVSLPGVRLGVWETEEEMDDRYGEGEMEEEGNVKRSCVERRQWLERMEKRMRSRRPCSSHVLNEMLEEMPPLKRMSGRSEPFQEREALRRGRMESTSMEYAAVVAGEGMLHPGVPVSGRGELGRVGVQQTHENWEQEEDRPGVIRVREEYSVVRSARRVETSPTSSGHSMSTTKAVVSSGWPKEAPTTAKHSIFPRKALVPMSATHSTSTINAIVSSERSVQTLTGQTTPSLFKSMTCMLSGTKFFKQAIALRETGQKNLQKQKRRSTDASSVSNSTSSKSRGTTSGVPNEIAAGSFGARSSPTDGKENKEKWWLTLFSSKAPSHDPDPGPGPWNKNAPWPLDPRQPPAEPRVGKNGSPVDNGNFDCAPGPSTGVLGRTSGLRCESASGPCRSTALPEGLKAPRTSREELANKAPRVKFEEPANKATRLRLQQPRTKTPRPGLEQVPMRTPAMLVTSPSYPGNKPEFLPIESNDSRPDRIVVTRSALPRTPAYGAIEPLAPQLRSTLGDVDSMPETSSPLRLDGVVVDERAIWIQCSERLDHVSHIAATEARERIRRNRAEMVAQAAVNVHKKRRNALAQEEMRACFERDSTSESVEGVPSVKVFATETAERVHMKRVKIGDVDCRSVAGRRELPPRKQDTKATTTARRKTILLANQKQPNEDLNIAIHKLDVVIRDLNAAAKRAATPSPSTKLSAQKPLHTPWEAAWHRDATIPLRQRLSQTPDTDSRAPSVPYSLSDAVAEAEAREQLHKPPSDEIVKLREGLRAKRGKLVHGADGQRPSMEAVVEDGMARFDSAMGMNEAKCLGSGKTRAEGGAAP